jgi:hypothetical protein
VTPPKAYDLALGDSLAYVFQQAKFNRELPNVDPACRWRQGTPPRDSLTPTETEVVSSPGMD